MPNPVNPLVTLNQMELGREQGSVRGNRQARRQGGQLLLLQGVPHERVQSPVQGHGCQMSIARFLDHTGLALHFGLRPHALHPWRNPRKGRGQILQRSQSLEARRAKPI